MLPVLGLERFIETEEVDFIMREILSACLFTYRMPSTRRDGLPALRGLAVPERLESRKFTGKAKVWHCAEIFARTVLALSNKEAVFYFSFESVF